jgi:hypothetical protein
LEAGNRCNWFSPHKSRKQVPAASKATRQTGGAILRPPAAAGAPVLPAGRYQKGVAGAEAHTQAQPRKAPSVLAVPNVSGVRSLGARQAMVAAK